MAYFRCIAGQTFLAQTRRFRQLRAGKRKERWTGAVSRSQNRGVGHHDQAPRLDSTKVAFESHGSGGSFFAPRPPPRTAGIVFDIKGHRRDTPFGETRSGNREVPALSHDPGSFAPGTLPGSDGDQSPLSALAS